MVRSKFEGPTLRRRESASGRVLCHATFNGKFVSFGPADDPGTRVRFQRFKAEWEANGRRLPAAHDGDSEALTVGDLVADYLEHAETYYRRRDGTPTQETANIRDAQRPLLELYGSLPAARFDVLKLETVRERMVAASLARKTINGRVARLRRMFGWGVSKRKVPAAVAAELRELDHLKAGRSAARETKPRAPVPLEHVQAVMPHLSRHLRALVWTMWHAGLRCGEVVQLRSRDVDMSGDVWVFRPPRHKNEWREIPREIDLGAEAQAVLRPFVQLDADRLWFRPRDAVAEHLARRSKARKTKRWPSHMRRNVAKRRESPALAPGDAYDTRAAANAIRRACERAGVPAWSPHQLRHAMLTRVRKAHGLEAALAVGGHGSFPVTESYTREARRQLARDVIAKMG